MIRGDLTKFIKRLTDKIEEINEFGASAIKPKVIKKLKEQLQNEYLSENKLSKDAIAKPLGLWCRAIYDFATLKKQVEPLELQAKELQIKLSKTENEFQIISKDLQKCKNEFQKLSDEFNEMDQKKRELAETIEQSKIKLGRAGKLTELLSEEGKRWKESIGILEKEKVTLVGDTFLSSAYISYIGPLTSVYRKKLMSLWKKDLSELAEKIVIKSDFNFLQIMGDPLKINQWCADGLPSDEISRGSGLSAMISEKYSYLIDPQQQAVKWLKNTLSQSENFIVVNQQISERKFNENVKLAI